MLSLKLLLLLVTATTNPVLATETPFESDEKPLKFHRRANIAPSERLSSYDFVIAGGDLSGLLLAAWLSDDSNKTVLVLEAGSSGDNVASRLSE